MADEFIICSSESIESTSFGEACGAGGKKFGTQDIAYWCWYNDIQLIVTNSTNTLAVTAITMKQGKFMRRWKGQNNSNAMTSIYSENGRRHEGAMNIYERDKSNIDNVIEAFNQSKICLIVFNKYSNTASTRMYGFENGLVVEATINPNNADTKGNIIANLHTADGEEERDYSLQVTTGTGATQEEKNIAYLDSLLEPDADVFQIRNQIEG